jgi:micrococcal nuclease
VRQSNATRSTEHGSGQTSQFRLRLLGVDTPETVKEDTPVEPFGPEATAFTRRFVANGQARLELDKRRVDRFGRSLAYLYVGEEMLNVELVRAGLARVAHYPGDSQSMHSLLRAAEREAQRERRGIWSLPAPANAP